MLRDDISLSEVRAPDTGDIDRLVDGTRWRVPKSVEVKNDRVYWDPDKRGEVGPSKGMLEAFCRLAEAHEKHIRDFAMKYGVLKICAHDLPCSHNPQQYLPAGPFTVDPSIPARLARETKLIGGGRCTVSFQRDRLGLALPGSGTLPRSGGMPRCSPLGWHDQGNPWDPLATWRAFSREAFALTKIADRVLRNKVGSPEDWATVYERSGRKAPWWKQDVRLERVIVADVVNEWLIIGDVRPSAVWHLSDKKPSVRLGGAGLFGALALQLALAIGQSAGFAICHHCGREYAPTNRRPKVGQRHFCKECREAGIPSRISLAEYREKLRSARDGLKTRD